MPVPADHLIHRHAAALVQVYGVDATLDVLADIYHKYQAQATDPEIIAANVMAEEIRISFNAVQ